MKINKRLNILINKFIVILLIAGFSNSAFPGNPGWHNVPKPLKQSPGVQIRKNWCYATGCATIVAVREDKAHEIARNKSFLRALQWLRTGGQCNSLIQSFPKDKHAALFELIVSQMPPVHMEQIQIIHQWEKTDHAYTTVAAPVELLDGLDCPFPDVESAIEHYCRQPDVSLNGLIFCLNYAARYSKLASDILEKTGQYLQQKGLVPLADCFAKDDAVETSVVPLIFQHNLNRAAQYIVQARQLSESGKWTEAIDLVNHAVSIVPSYSPAYLLMAEYLLKEKNQPELALAAVQKALRDGCCFIPAMKLNMLCLNRLKSDEEQIYAYLVKKSEEKGISTYPVQLPDFIKIQTDTTIPDLIINSAGCAVEGKDQPPDERFTQAMIKFQNAKSDEDVRGVLILLLKAISCQPFSAKTHNLIGACLRHLNQPMLALPFLWQAVRLKPDYDLSLTNLGICCDQLGQRKSAAYYFNHPAVTQSTNNWVKKQKNGFKTIQ